MALTAALKAQIAAWYKALQQQIPDFIPRAPQRQMIADVAKTLAGDEGRHLAIEAPTGVGKTLSYLIPGIAIAREEQKTLVVSTANVALQDQIYSKDLPLLRKIIPELRFTAAFGRGRYVCPRNLTALASTEPTQQDLLAFLDDELTPNNKAEQEQCARLKADLDSYKWDGLRDHTDQALSDELWRRLSTDKASCLNRNCHYYRECPFFVARREIQEAEVVVANHALVMAAMESEAVLPDPKNLLLVLDEGHHLPDVARDALEMSAEITAPWFRLQLDLFCKLVATCMDQFRPKTIPPLAIPERLSEHCETIYSHIASLNNMLNLYLPPGQEAEHRFEMGTLPEEIMDLCRELAQLIEKLRGLAELFLNDLSEKTGTHDVVRVHRVLLQMNRALGMFEGQSKLWRLASMAQASGAPVTKWATREVREGQVHLFFHCAGIRVSDQLEKLLWRSVPHVVVTSATLRSLNSFSRLQEMSGLKEKAGDRFVALDSPFNHCEQGKLVIPRMQYEPLIDNEEQHLAEMAAYFREQLESKKYPGMLVLFASARAMNLFLTFVTDLRLLLLVQGDQPRYRLVELHRKRIEAGERSVLVGLQSFAEGLDLKGDYLTQVHIHKIAFPPIDSPVVLTEGEWLKSLNRFPFEVQSLPAASFNLIQQVGRLIRSHSCWGEVVIYDKRLLTKNYGKRLLNALPVFPIEQPEVPKVKKRPAKLAAGRRKSIRAKGRGPTGK
ncbi:ATP-dependent DNA helicase DinG [Leclercia sp. LSNIH1]|uniref:ATP-dependent DNA helicase DinG n=1 Tax=Leclercia sp. LSNIH1 TaxID=1920114 RepID=UPI000CD1A2A3|nr:ATP-dependent DNA helicase DinG [Leclercia sp. LSNIH1]AUU84636.1 ATP-dependent DNA helicase DinG [Leclercia sp. LSNIH1]POV35289.1 ATP-dependent DNA helicase DinG [Leclercia sp. LSNIH5]POW67562.1 ATP-dependent DNA helicase DinG [Leclercia sp. LSNIH2]